MFRGVGAKRFVGCARTNARVTSPRSAHTNTRNRSHPHGTTPRPSNASSTKSPRPATHNALAGARSCARSHYRSH